MIGVAVVTAYLLGAASWIYGVASRSDTSSGIPGEFLMALPLFVVGFAVGRWWALLVPLCLPLLAAGAGRGTNHNADLEIWAVIAQITVPIGLLLTAAGVALARILRS
jgi:hypothetical protein